MKKQTEEVNQFTFHHKKGTSAKIEMIISTSLLNQFKELMDIEIELFFGVHYMLNNGMHHCIIEVDGYKREMFEDFMRMLVKHPSMKVNIMGLPINNN